MKNEKPTVFQLAYKHTAERPNTFQRVLRQMRDDLRSANSADGGAAEGKTAATAAKRSGG